MQPAAVQLPTVSFRYFGEATSLPVKIQKAALTICAAPTIGQHLTTLELTVVNECQPGDIAAKLKLPLPHGAAVCRFEFLRGEQWFPAVPVEAKKAKEVAYKEKEKGRSVAAASQAQGNVFEIEVFPLTYQKPSRCRLWYSSQDGSVPFAFDAGTLVEVKREGSDAAAPPALPSAPAACVGECFGQVHFACFVPHVPAEASVAPQSVALLWDTSASQEGDHASRFESLRALASRCPGMRFEVWSFGVAAEKRAAGQGTVDEAIAALGALRYDGGTDLALVPKIVQSLDSSVEAVLLFSDGMDSLGRRPAMPSPCPPVHCVLDGTSVNLPLLSAVSLATGGQLLRGDYLPVLRPQTTLGDITTDQSDEDFASGGDGFDCCPDHRLQMRWPVGQDGAWICGVRGGVRKLSLRLHAGAEIRDLEFDLSSAPALPPAAAPLLGHLLARQRYAAVERDGAAMGLDLAKVKAELALRYGFCSPEASLLMLYEPEQFVDNGIDCPKDHPAHAAWRAATAGESPEVKEGEIGQRKTASQREVVTRLAKALKDYIAKPIPDREVLLMGSMAGGGGGPRRCVASSIRPTAREAVSLGSVAVQCLRSAAVMARHVMEPQPAMMLPSCEISRDALEQEEAAEEMDFDLFDGGAPAAPASRGRAAPARRQAASGAVATDCEAYAEGKEQGYLRELQDALTRGGALEVYARLRSEHGASPSFFLYTARAIIAHSVDHADWATRVCSNCLEINLQDVQMMRSVGYFLLKVGRSEFALAVLDRVRALAPAEPQSFLDGALARTLCCLRGGLQEALLREAVELAATVVTHAWADRFSEIEWPALVLLHLLSGIAGRHGLADPWPLEQDLRVTEFSLGLVVWLGWDTDETDIDLHVIEPNGNEVYYSNKHSGIGGHLSKDFTQGYGPEVYVLKSPPSGTYAVSAKYYDSHQQSSLTGATSAVIWALSGQGEQQQLHFDTVRLDRNKERMEVMKVVVP